MIIWLLILIPVITIAILMIFYHRRMVWWEYIVQIGVALFLIFLMKIIGEKSQTRDIEYWGDLVKEARYYEPYSIWDHETCTRQVACGTDSDGNTKYCTETYDCSHLDSYPARWIAITTTGWEIRIDESLYKSLIKKFQDTPCFYNMHREKECGFGDYVVNDGDMYFVTWDNDPKKSYAVAKTHIYKNKVQCSNSVFNYQKVDEEEAKAEGLYDYPDVKNDIVATILGGSQLAKLDSAEAKFRYLNGKLGPEKQLRVWILIFNDRPLSTGQLQEAYWKNGNKNEFVVTIGLNKEGNVSWCHAFSWTEVQELKIGVRDYVMSNQTLDLMALSDHLYKELETKWVRKEFKDFSYLTVEPPLWALILALVLQILFNFGYATWAVKNDYEEE